MNPLDFIHYGTKIIQIRVCSFQYPSCMSLSGEIFLNTEVSSFQNFWIEEFHCKPNIPHMLVAVHRYFIAWVTFPWCSLHQSPIASNTASGWWMIMSGPCKISYVVYYYRQIYNTTFWSQQCVAHSSLPHNIIPIDIHRVHYVWYEGKLHIGIGAGLASAKPIF